MDDTIILPPNSKAIPLTQGKFAIVDEADYDWLNQWKWYFSRMKNGLGYAKRELPNRGGEIGMHRFIIDCPSDRWVDHINGEQLDKRRLNLRICTPKQNSHNRKAHKLSISKFKGVSWHKPTDKWVAMIKDDGKSYNLGSFAREVDAALAYDEAAKRIQGNFARLNIINSELR